MAGKHIGTVIKLITYKTADLIAELRDSIFGLREEISRVRRQQSDDAQTSGRNFGLILERLDSQNADLKAQLAAIQDIQKALGRTPTVKMPVVKSPPPRLVREDR